MYRQNKDHISVDYKILIHILDGFTRRFNGLFFRKPIHLLATASEDTTISIMIVSFIVELHVNSLQTQPISVTNS